MVFFGKIEIIAKLWMSEYDELERAMNQSPPLNLPQKRTTSSSVELASAPSLTSFLIAPS